MATINFYLEKKKNVSEQSIFARCKHGSQDNNDFKYYIGKKVSPKEWNVNTQRMRGTTIEATQINNLIDTIQNGFLSIVMKLKTAAIEAGFKKFSIDDLKIAFYNKFGTKGSNQTTKTNTNQNQIINFTLPELLDKYMTFQKNTLKKITTKTYISVKNLVVKFSNDHKIKSIDYETFYIPFLNFLVETGLNNSTINIYITKIKTAIQYFLDYTDFITDNPKLRLWKNLKTPPEKHITFSEEQILNLYKMQFSKEEINVEKHKLTKKRFRRIIDSFVFSFYTGLARMEINNMKIIDITAKNTLSITRQKTNKAIEIPLNHICLEIIEKYKSSDSPKIIPKASVGTAVYNKFLKKILENSKLFEAEVKLTKYVGTNKIEKIVPLWDAITFHSARHSYATYMLGKGLAITDVQKLLGHTNVLMTQKYANVLNDELMERARKILDAKNE
jgi:site-specific recombinase XerD